LERGSLPKFAFDWLELQRRRTAFHVLIATPPALAEGFIDSPWFFSSEIRIERPFRGFAGIWSVDFRLRES
jgi:hypothetical protein